MKLPEKKKNSASKSPNCLNTETRWKKKPVRNDTLNILIKVWNKAAEKGNDAANWVFPKDGLKIGSCSDG